MANIDLEILAISDTHLGEDHSLLSFPQGRWKLWKQLRDHFGIENGGEINDRFKVEELILIGDIPDRTLSSTSQIITHTNALMRTLASAADIKKCVYLPGNHDHTLWSTYVKKKTENEGNKKDFDITTPSGDVLVKDGIPQYQQDELKIIEELLCIFFGYPYGSLWRNIEKGGNFEFAIANPVYAKRIKDRTFAFAHGTHFKPVVCTPEVLKKIGDWSQLDKIIAGIEIEPGNDPTNAEDVKDSEKRIHKFVDTLWPSSKHNPTSRSDQLYYVLTSLSGKFGDKRGSPEKSELFPWEEMKKVRTGRFYELVKKITGEPDKAMKEDKQLGHFMDSFLKNLLEFLDVNDLQSTPLTFVYGDSHTGGWSELPHPTNAEEPNIRVFNTGGWVIHNAENHPPCHIFAVDKDGKEHVLDISYKNAKIDGDKLLEITAQDAENRSRGISLPVRVITGLLSWVGFK